MSDTPEIPAPPGSAGGEGEVLPGAPAQPSKTRAERREQAAVDVLRTFVRDQHLYKFGAVPPRAEEVDIQLKLKVRPSNDWALQFDPPLADQLAAQLEDAQAGWDVYRKGRVYCFRCESSECEHARPDSPHAVFRGYAPNGLPEWSDLAQVLLAVRDSRVDRLYEAKAGPVALMQLGGELKERQLSSFGKSSKTYAVLGQVVAGYFSLNAPEENSGEVAVTLQAVEMRTERGALCLKLNVLARIPGGEDIGNLLGGGWQPGLHRALEVAARQLGGIEQGAAAARAEGDGERARVQLRRVPSVLRELAESIERAGRQQGRRTRHAEVRRKEQRPVHKAVEDARAAAASMIFCDEKAGTMIVCGPQGRAHAFAPDGRHVTSFILRPGAVAFRLRTQRWRPVTPDESARFHEQVETFIPKKAPPSD